MKIERYLVSPGKLAYVRGKKAEVGCVLCAVREDDERVSRLVVFRGRHMLVSLNLHPYNRGHLLIFPAEHLADIRKLSREAVLETFSLQKRAMTALEALYNPTGFYIGYNVGSSSGASIEHIHCHVIPRLGDELDLIEHVGRGRRLNAEDPLDTLEKISRAFAAAPAES